MNARDGHRLTRRNIFMAAGVAVVLMVAVCVAVLVRVKPHLTNTDFQNVQIGMTRAELHRLLGSPDHEQIVLGMVTSPTSMTVNFSDGEYRKRLQSSGYNDHILECWFSPSITIMAYVDAKDQVVCRYSAGGQRPDVLGRIFSRRKRVSLQSSK